MCEPGWVVGPRRPLFAGAMACCFTLRRCMCFVLILCLDYTPAIPHTVQVVRLVDALTAEEGVAALLPLQGPWRVHVTGHSLGGALATLCAFELASRQ